MHYSESWEEVKNLVKERADIVEIIREHVDLKRSGFRYLGSCPFHQEKTPSFTVHPDQQFYHCFGCKASGDVFSFMMEYHHMEFPEALKALAQRYQVDLPEKKRSAQELEQQKRRTRMFELNMRAAEIFHTYLLEEPGAEKARLYLQKRGIPGDTQSTYKIGYAPSKELAGWNFLGSRLNGDERKLALEIGLLVSKEAGRSYDRFRDRIMCPIFDTRGQITGFGGRILGDGEPKYLNSPDSPVYNKSRLLFGLYQQKDPIRKRRKAVLVEGNFDLLSLVAQGFDYVVAPLGTALTRDQIRQLKPLVDEVVLLFDGDSAGIKAAERSVPLFLAEQISGRVAMLPEDHDPDTFIREFGVGGINDIVDGASPLPEFVLERFVERHGETLDGKFKIIEELRPLMVAVSSPIQREAMAKHFGMALNVDPGRLLAEFKPLPKTKIEKVVPAVKKKGSPGKMLGGALKSVLGFMVLHPKYFGILQQEGIEDLFAGTIGEMICLQLKVMHEQGRIQLEPEELFNELPQGEERTLVASLLTEPTLSESGDPDDNEEMLTEILSWLKRERSKKRSEQLMREIKDAEKAQNFEAINSLILEKMRVDSELKTGG